MLATLCVRLSGRKPEEPIYSSVRVPAGPDGECVFELCRNGVLYHRWHLGSISALIATSERP